MHNFPYTHTCMHNAYSGALSMNGTLDLIISLTRTPIQRLSRYIHVCGTFIKQIKHDSGINVKLRTDWSCL